MSATPKREDDASQHDDLWRELLWSASLVGGVLLALGLAGWAAPVGP